MDIVTLIGILASSEAPAFGFDISIWPTLLGGPIVIILAILYVYLTEWRKKE